MVLIKTLNDALKSTVIEDLRNINLIFFNYYVKDNRETIIYLHSKKIIDTTSIDTALKESILKQSRRDYNAITTENSPYIIDADHVGRPDCLAYAIGKRQFSEEEIENIPFGQGETVKTFLRQNYEGGLPSLLRKELLYKKQDKILEHDRFYDSRR